MAVLDQATRDRMPKKDFAGPGTSFPVNDRTHAKMAISGASRSEHAGNISAGEAERIKSEARAKLAHWGKSGDSDPKSGSDGMDHKGAVAKMHPDHVHRLVTEAATGMHGDKAMEHAHHAMQMPQDGMETGGSGGSAMQEAKPKSSPFNDNDGDEGGSGNAPSPAMSRSSMFGMDGGE